MEEDIKEIELIDFLKVVWEFGRGSLTACSQRPGWFGPFLRYRYVPAPRAIFRATFNLLPGHSRFFSLTSCPLSCDGSPVRGWERRTILRVCPLSEYRGNVWSNTDRDKNKRTSLRQGKPPPPLPVRFDMGNVAGTLAGQLGSDNRDHDSHH